MRFHTYMVIDGDGNAVSDGLGPSEAHRVAQRIADQRGEAVWLCPSGDAGDAEAEAEEDTPEGLRVDPE